MAKKAYEESNIANIAVAIREKTGGNKTYKTSEMPSGINEVYDKGCIDGYNEGYTNGDSEGYDKGRQAEYDDFWNVVQDNGNRTDYSSFFCSYSWNDTTFKPKYKMYVSRAWEMFYKTKITKLTNEQIDFSNCNSAYNCFGQSSIIELPIIDLSNTSVAHYFMYGCTSLKRVEKIIISEKITNFGYFVMNCLALEHIIFEGVITASIGFKQSSLLDNASIQSIINCLADLTGQTAQTLTLHADVGAKLTDEQKVTITAKNWILAY